MIRFWMVSCSHCVKRTGKRAPLLDGLKIRVRHLAGLSGAASRLAAATASCTAMLMPTPPIGDIACAASPMQIRPGRHHFLQPVDRDAEQLDVIPAFQFADAVGEKRRHVDDPPRKASSPSACTFSMPPLGMT